MHWVTHLTLLALTAANTYLIFVAGAAIALLLTLLLHLLLLVRPEERIPLLREMVETAKADLVAVLKRLRFWR